MKTDKTKLLQDIEAMKEKLTSMEKELNKTEEFKHFPSEGDKYYYYIPTGILCSNTSADDELKVNAYQTEREAQKAYNKAVALEKVKRRLIELQGDWKPTWEEYSFWDDYSYKYIIYYSYNTDRFEVEDWTRIKYPTLIPYIETSDIANIIIEEMEDELKLIFDIA